MLREEDPHRQGSRLLDEQQQLQSLRWILEAAVACCHRQESVALCS